MYFNAKIPREWIYLINSGVVGIFGALLFTLTLFMNLYTLLLVSIGVAMILSHTAFVFTAGKEDIFSLTLTSLLFPFLTGSSIYLYAVKNGFFAASHSFIINLTILAAVLALNKELNEYLFQVNSNGLKGSSFPSKLLLDKECDIHIGEEGDVPVRNIGIKNEHGGLDLFVPWVHAGPVASFGGSRISTDSIDEQDSSFFLHAPSSHFSDVTSVGDKERILDKKNSPDEYFSQATKIRKVEGAEFNLYGRGYGDKKLILIDSEFDDYKRSIFDKYLEDENLVVVDLHGEEDRAESDILSYNSQSANAINEEIGNLVDKIGNSERHTYEAGWCIEERDKSIFAMVEQVGDEKSLLLFVNENEASESTRKAYQRFEEDYTNVFVSTTDSHRSVYDQVVGYENPFSDYESIVEEAEEKLIDAALGINYENVENVRLFKDSYLEFMGSLNILLRLYPLSVAVLLVLYFFLTII